MNDRNRRPFVARNGVEPGHLCVRIMKCQQRESARNPDRPSRFAPIDIGPPSDVQWRAALRFEMRFERRELGRLELRDVTRAHVAGEWLENRGRCAKSEREPPAPGAGGA